MSHMIPVGHGTRTRRNVLIGLAVSVLLTARGSDSVTAPASAVTMRFT